jgi:hypothetical protein
MSPEISPEAGPAAPTHLGDNWPGMKAMNGDEGDDGWATNFGRPTVRLVG